jgi:hypothetical protein
MEMSTSYHAILQVKLRKTQIRTISLLNLGWNKSQLLTVKADSLRLKTPSSHKTNANPNCVQKHNSLKGEDFERSLGLVKLSRYENHIK